MNIGKTLFAQLMDFLPWSTFARIVAGYGGDARVRTLCCAEQYRAMAFAQLTYRESLRDIEVCLSARASKLYHMGFREPVRRSNSGRRQRDARLAHLRGVRSPSDCPSEEGLCQRKPGYGAGQHGLCSGFHDHRSVPVAISMGALSLHHRAGARERGLTAQRREYASWSRT